MTRAKELRLDVLVQRVERRTLSTLGNPRFYLHTDRGRFATITNGSIGYDVENIFRRIPAAGLPVRLITNTRRHVTDIIGQDDKRITT